LSLEEDQELESIRNEISILRECDHPNIVKYYGSYFKDEYLWVRLCFICFICFIYLFY